MNGTTTPVLRAAGVTKTYQLRPSLAARLTRTEHRTDLRALDGVDLELRRGEVLALVGESGSGKSTLAKVLVGSTTPSGGSLEHDGEPVPARRGKDASRRIQMVFQDPYSSLNPRISVASMLRELLLLHDVVPRAQVRQESVRLLNLVGLEEDALDAYPSQFSGGQRQRLAIARALAVRPDVLIADEPVSALDVSVQATILDLFARLQRDLGLSILFVAHNLAVVQHLSQRVAVMYLGRIVEVADTAELFANPRHPYTRPSSTRSRGCGPAASTRTSSWRANRRAPTTSRPGAGSTRAARTPSTPAGRSTRRWRRSSPGTSARACARTSCPRSSPRPTPRRARRSSTSARTSPMTSRRTTPKNREHRTRGAPHREGLDVAGHGGRRRDRRLGPVPSRQPRVRAGLRAAAGRGERRDRGAIAGGATEVVLNDSHSRMANLDPRGSPGRRSTCRADTSRCT